MKVRPLHDRLIVQRLDPPRMPRCPHRSGLGQRETATGQGARGGSRQSNDKGKRVPLDVKAGDTILFGKYSGQEIKLDGVEYLS